MFSERYITSPDVHEIIDEVPLYGALTQTRKVLSLNWLDRDSDGDTISDGADDQDGDGISNRDELVTEITSSEPVSYLPINPCAPNLDARLCIVGDDDIDKDGIPNRADDDDDGDLLSDVDERRYKTNPFKADTDGDGVTDGFEFFSAKDLNGAALPYPGKQPYPNPLDKDDGVIDHDGDGLSLYRSIKAWRYTGSPLPLSYSDGKQRSDGGAYDSRCEDADGDGAEQLRRVRRPVERPGVVGRLLEHDNGVLREKYVETPYPVRSTRASTSSTRTPTATASPTGRTTSTTTGSDQRRRGAGRRADWCDVYVSVGRPPAG